MSHSLESDKASLMRRKNADAQKQYRERKKQAEQSTQKELMRLRRENQQLRRGRPCNKCKALSNSLSSDSVESLADTLLGSATSLTGSPLTQNLAICQNEWSRKEAVAPLDDLASLAQALSMGEQKSSPLTSPLSFYSPMQNDDTHDRNDYLQFPHFFNPSQNYNHLARPLIAPGHHGFGYLRH